MGLAHPPYGWRLDPREKHVAQQLGEAGYSTTLVGMQHLIEHGSAVELGYERVLPVAAATSEATSTVALLRELAASPRPFYLEVGFEEPHRPYDFGGAQPDDTRGVTIPPYLPDAPQSRQDLAAFQGAIRQMDTGVGQVLSALDELGLSDRTHVIFATDHGAAMPRAKCTLYDPGIEVALLWRPPTESTTFGRGSVMNDLVSNVDVAPSLMAALGLPPPPRAHGQSLWSAVSAARGSYVPRREIFAEKTFHTYYEPMRAIRTNGYKLIINFEISTAVDVPADIRDSPIYPLLRPQFDAVRQPVELYNLQSDPWEQHNLADTPDVQSEQGDLRQRLLRWMLETDDPLLDGPVASPYYRDAVARLRAN